MLVASYPNAVRPGSLPRWSALVVNSSRAGACRISEERSGWFRVLTFVRKLILIYFVLFLATFSFAGVTYTVVTTTSQDGETYTMRVRTVVDGANARIEILEGGPAPFNAGAWMLTRDGGKTFLVFNPTTKTYSELTPHNTLDDVDAKIEKQTKVTNTTPQIKLVSQEAGPELVGYATSHARFSTSYVVTFKLVDSFTAHVVKEDEVWAAPALRTLSAKDAPALSAGAQMGIDPLAGFPQFQQLGFPLKRVTETKSESVDGTVEHIVTTMEVKEIKEGPVDPSNFSVPAGYKKVDRQPATE